MSPALRAGWGWRIARLLAPILLIAIALAVVVKLDETPAGADLVFVNTNEIFTLDPQRMSYLQDLRLAHGVYEGLVEWDNRNFSIHPAVAERVPEPSQDGCTWRFPIRENARWSNGDPVTAHDFVWSWQRAILPDTAADYSHMFFVIDGAEEFFRWRLAQTAALLADPEGAAPVAWRSAWDEAQERFHATVGVRAIDDRTLEVRLRRPVAYFLDLLSFGVFFPVHRPTVEGWSDSAKPLGTPWHSVELPPWEARRWVHLGPGGRLVQDHGWCRAGLHVGNGPYALTQWRYKRDMRLERNPFYRDPARAQCDSILALTIEEGNTAVLAFESGHIDWLADVAVEYQADMLDQLARYERRHASTFEALVAQGFDRDQALAQLPEPGPGERRNIHAFPTFGTDFYSFNCRERLSGGGANPFADPRVRRAFALSVDKRTIVEKVTRLREPVATTLIPPGSIDGYRSPAGLPFDPARAQAELRDAGWSDRDGDGLVEDAAGNRFPVIDLLYTTNLPRYKWISLELKSQWERRLGVRIELRGTETKFYKEDLKQGKFMIARGRWYGDYGDPTTFLDICHSTDGNNDRAYASAEVDGLLAAAAIERDPAKRLELLSQCEEIIVDRDVPMLALCQLVQLYMYEPGRVTGLSDHPRLVQLLAQIGVEKRRDDR